MDPKLKHILQKVENGDILSAHIYELVDTYYQCIVYKDDTDEPEDNSYPKELLLQLPDRNSGIFEALTTLIRQGYDVHESDGSFNALMLAVGSADEPMTAFLLTNGANPHTWPDMDEVKHSDKIVEQQTRFLRMEELNKIAEKKFGKIAGKYVIYRGKTQEVDGIQYVNVEEYLNNLAS